MRPVLLALSVAVALVSSLATAAEEFQPNWESLRRHTPAPEWFRDAKYGVYFHWGVYSVPAYGNEWYPKRMHDKGEGGNSSVYKHHVEKYGSPAEYGYDRFVPQFTAEHFDAEEWVDLFAKSGAQFVGPVAEHHDGFAMWDSDATPWNSVDRGPKRDVLGEITDAAKKRGLKTVATLHHARNNLWQIEQNGKKEWTGHYAGAMQHFPEVLNDPERAILYGKMPREEFLEMWLTKLEEIIDGYSPDLIWFDSWLHEIPDEYQQKFAAYYLNHAAKNGQEVVITYKQKDFPQDIGVLDIEKGSMRELSEFPWLCDDTISLGSWCYTEDLRIKPTATVLHSLIDIVSKNGQLLLNVSPKADGTIPENQRKVLLELGEWLDQYGEAIYGTRPFTIYGHGTTVAGDGHFGGIATDKGYTADDVRYTTKGKTVYAFVLGAPKAGTSSVLRGFAAEHGGKYEVDSVKLLGSDEKVSWRSTADGVEVDAPKESPNTMAIVYRIETK